MNTKAGTDRCDADGDRRGDLRWPTIPALWADAVKRFGSDEALVDGDVRFTWTELDAHVQRAARAFLALGIEPQDRVAIWAPNCWEWVVTLLGLQHVGAVVVPLNTRYKGTEAGFILGKSRARVLVTVNGFLGNRYVELLGTAHPRGDLPELEHIVVARTSAEPGGAPEDTISWDQFVSCAAGADEADVRARTDDLNAESLSDVLFTSGTTGAPKGVLCTHGQSIRAFTTWSEVVGLRHGDRYLIVNPFFHTFGYKAGILACLITGAVMVPLAVFDVPAVLERIRSEHISMIPGPPTLYQSMLNHADRTGLDPTSLRLAVTGAAAVPVSLVQRMRDDLGFETVVTGYGLTEATGIVTMCRHDDDAETIAHTSGRAIPGVEVRVVDDTGSEVPRGHPGELVVRGYNVMHGYFEDPDETAEAVDADGWLHTGDIATMDERGYVAITDRKKDMFIVGGFNAYPAEIENLLSAHPSVGQVAVVGVPDDRLGEVGVAFVVPAGGQTVAPDALMAWARETMANFKVPRRVEVVDALPTNAGGKVLKYELRRLADPAGATLEPQPGGRP